MNAILDQRIGVKERVASGVSELISADRVLAHTWQVFVNEKRTLLALVKEHSRQLDQEFVEWGFDQVWTCDEPSAIRSLFMVELMVASLLNHLYIVTEQVVILTKKLFVNHDLAINESLRAVNMKAKGWKKRVRRSLADGYAPLEPHCHNDLSTVLNLITVRGERVHTRHLNAHIVHDGKDHIVFQYSEQLRDKEYKTALVSRELEEGMADLQCFLQWYVEAIRKV